MIEKPRQSLANLGRALDRLGEALDEPTTNPLAIDGTIQRFEFAVELCWKTFRRLLEAEGVSVATPREAMREAYRAGWLADEDAWLQMLRDRNKSSHLYSEGVARDIYDNIRTYFPEMRSAYETVKTRADQSTG
jgi:nucleotidyltransferase substrate binding protein (TIGR01987 family)